MNRLYLFAIGGTGARVLKSLTMLLASGVQIQSKDNYEIVPIIIDPHKGNEDLKRTERLLSNYQSIQSKMDDGSGFFASKISTLDELSVSSTLSKSFTFGLEQVDQTRFKDYIDFKQLSKENKAMADILFSGKTTNKRGEEIPLLDTEMDIGFIGNPNIGSVVLNQLKSSLEFKEFANSFKSGDRIFIISSIFGGTGAAGFPTLLKHIRDAKNNPNIDSKGLLENAPVGAVTLMPYFNLKNRSDSPIQKSDFIAKTRSALKYYENNICKNNSINALYYLADKSFQSKYDNDPGEKGQRNPAHIVELFAALAIIDFLEIPSENVTTINGKAQQPIYRGFGVKQDAASMQFEHWCDRSQQKLTKPLSQLSLFKKYVEEQLTDALDRQSWSTDAPIVGDSFVQESFYRTNIREFLDAYGDWLQELKEKGRFDGFNLESSLNTLIKGREIKKGWLSSDIKMSKIDDFMNKQSKGKSYVSAEHKFVTLLANATEELLAKEYGITKR